MRKEAKIPWSTLANHAKWGGLGLLLAIAGAVGCVNFSLTQPQTKPLTPVAKRPRLPAYAAANLKKTPARGTRQVAENMSRRSAQQPAVASRTARPTTAPVIPTSPSLAARRTPPTDPRVAARTAVRPNPVANQRVNPYAKVQPKPAQKAPQALATAFDARKSPSVVQAGANTANPSRILRIGGTPVADPFLDISTSSDDRPAEVPEPPPEAVPQISRQPQFSAPEGEAAAPGIAPPEQSDEMPPLPIERADADERANQPPAIEQTSDEGSRDRYDEPNRAFPPKYPPPKANNTSLRNRYFRLPRRGNAATTTPANRHRFSENLDHDQPPAPRELAPLAPPPATSQKPRATPRRERRPIDYETLDSGELLRPLDPELAQLPRLGETSNSDTPQVELLDSPPQAERGQVAEDEPNSLNGGRRAVAGHEPLNSQMADSFADAAEAHPLPPGSAPGLSYDQASRATPWAQQRGVPARTVSRQRHSRFTGSEETPPTISPNKRVALPIIRPAQRNGQTPLPVVTSRHDASKPTAVPQQPAGAQVSELAEGNPREDLEPPQAQFPPPAASSAVRLDGIVIEDDDTAVAPTAHRGQVRLAPPDIMESSPNTVPPPPQSTVPPPLIGSTLPPLPASTPANGNNGAGKNASATVPLEPSSLDLSLEDNNDSNAPKRSIIGNTSLIGLGVGITGLLGLLLWRYLDRRSHRLRRLNLSLLKAAEAKLPVAQEAALKIAEPAAAESEAPRLHRAA